MMCGLCGQRVKKDKTNSVISANAPGQHQSDKDLQQLYNYE